LNKEWLDKVYQSSINLEQSCTKFFQPDFLTQYRIRAMSPVNNLRILSVEQSIAENRFEELSQISVQSNHVLTQIAENQVNELPQRSIQSNHVLTPVPSPRMFSQRSVQKVQSNDRLTPIAEDRAEELPQRRNQRTQSNHVLTPVVENRAEELPQRNIQNDDILTPIVENQVEELFQRSIPSNGTQPERFNLFSNINTVEIISQSADFRVQPSNEASQELFDIFAGPEGQPSQVMNHGPHFDFFDMFPDFQNSQAVGNDAHYFANFLASNSQFGLRDSLDDDPSMNLFNLGNNAAPFFNPGNSSNFSQLGFGLHDPPEFNLLTENSQNSTITPAVVYTQEEDQSAGRRQNSDSNDSQKANLSFSPLF